MIVNILTLLSLGFIVGISGAMIPGPLLAFTIFDTTRRGKITGLKIIIGHALWELVVIMLIISGLGWIVIQNKSVIYALGGVVLLLMGASMTMNRKKTNEKDNFRVDSSILGGLLYTAFNPTQPPWWATAGLALLLKGIELMGAIGLVWVTVGHWLSDFSYYVFVSFMVNRHGRYINPRQREISIILGVFMSVLGAYFLIQGLHSIWGT